MEAVEDFVDFEAEPDVGVLLLCLQMDYYLTYAFLSINHYYYEHFEYHQR